MSRRMARAREERHLPLSAAEFEVLIALADGEKHGYAVLKEVARRTGGRVSLSPATLYTIVRRFAADALLVESSARPDPALDDERRRYYRLTEFGRQVAAAEAERMETALAMARAKNLIRKPRLA
ncbi:MAG TPA: PadR family transcriptional regulator [Vicinamibacteria bacterium]|nr:PadR family transcriptional regulator [Vicinamibacteria bacterium]